jgi:hypothetical protein
MTNIILPESKKLILLDDEFSKRRAKHQEIEYYESQLKGLVSKQNYINHEIKLTKQIIQMVRDEIKAASN